MIAAGTIVALVALLGYLFLAMRGLKARNLPFETTAWMAVAWIVIIVVLTFAIWRFGG